LPLARLKTQTSRSNTVPDALFEEERETKTGHGTGRPLHAKGKAGVILGRTVAHDRRDDGQDAQQAPPALRIRSDADDGPTRQ